jgi:hypothetical protein
VHQFQRFRIENLNSPDLFGVSSSQKLEIREEIADIILSRMRYEEFCAGMLVVM